MPLVDFDVNADTEATETVVTPAAPSYAPSPDPALYLPQPPTLSERWRYLNPSKTWIWLGLLAYLCILVSSCWFLWRTQFWWYLPYIVLTAAWTLPHLLFVLVSQNFKLADHIQVMTQGLTSQERPSVDVFITTCGEDLKIIENTLIHASQLTYQPLTIYVLDDGNSADVKELAAAYSMTYLSRPNRGEQKKAGNLLYGYQHSRGDFILVLDADFAPAPCMLEHLIPWMKSDPNIAILQTPQYFDTTSTLNWTARGAAYCQEIFYRLIQPSRDFLGSSAICVGTNALYRRGALETNGGFFQVPASEDVHNGVALIHKGWKVKYLPIILAKGLCPDNVQALFRQHYRWCSGSMRLILSRFFWQSRLPTWQKLIYLCGACYYPSTALSLLVALLQLSVMVLWLYQDVHWYVIILFLPKLLLIYIVMPLWNQAAWGLHSVKAAVTFSWAYFIAIWDLLQGQTEGWIATGSQQRSARYQRFRQLLRVYCLAHAILLVPIALHDWQQFTPILLNHGFAIYIGLELLTTET